MSVNRRSLLQGSAAACLIPRASRAARAASIVDATGRSVSIPDRVARVLPAGAPAAIMLYALAPDLLLGWPRANRSEECEFMLPDVCSRPEIGRLTGRGNTANLETVLALKPDLIVDAGSTSPTLISLAARVQEQTGIPYALLDGRFAATVESCHKLGELVQRQSDAEKLAQYADRTFRTLTARVAAVPQAQRPRVYYARGPRGLETGLAGSINVETIEFLGGRNVAAEGKGGGLTTVSIEQVLLWNPDVIITIDREFAASVRSDPVWAPVAAVRSGRVHLSPKVPFGWVDFPPSINRLVGLWWLAKIFYPEKVPEDIPELTRDFYRLFYHVTLDDTQIARVLAGRD